MEFQGGVSFVLPGHVEVIQQDPDEVLVPALQCQSQALPSECIVLEISIASSMALPTQHCLADMPSILLPSCNLKTRKSICHFSVFSWVTILTVDRKATSWRLLSNVHRALNDTMPLCLGYSGLGS